MQGFIKSICLIVFGFALGWIAQMRQANQPNSFLPGFEEITVDSVSLEDLNYDEEQAGSSTQDTPLYAPNTDLNQGPTENLDEVAELVLAFQGFLDAGRYSLAMEVYNNVKYNFEGSTQKFRELILEKLRELLRQESHAEFTELIDIFLEDEYNDIDVLLLQAQFNQNLDYIEEAARVYQLALSYALNTGQKNRINQSLSEFVLSTDSALSEGQEWWELQNFYYVLEESALLRPNYQYRLAEVLIYNGNPIIAEEYLIKLVNNERLGSKAKNLLDTLNDPQVPEPTEAIADTAEGIPLKKFRDHYQIDVMLSGTETVNLLVDTGASLTSVSRDHFNSILDNIEARRVRSMMFNTAGGMTRGTVYRVDKIKIGPFTLEDIRIAVLNYKGSHGAKGLLGMNVLRNFKFQLNQDESKLYLQKR